MMPGLLWILLLKRISFFSSLSSGPLTGSAERARGQHCWWVSHWELHWNAVPLYVLHSAYRTFFFIFLIATKKENYKLQSIYRRGELFHGCFCWLVFPAPFKVNRFFPDRPYSISLGAHACPRWTTSPATCFFSIIPFFWFFFLGILIYSSNHCRMKKPTDV